MQVLNTLPSSESRSMPRSVVLSRRAALMPLLKSPRRVAPLDAPKLKMATFVCLAPEPEDATMTGATRSLSRRLLALNIRDDA